MPAYHFPPISTHGESEYLLESLELSVSATAVLHGEENGFPLLKVALAPLPLRDRARDGTVPVAMAYAVGALHALPDCGDGSAAVDGRFRRAQPGPPSAGGRTR